MIHGQLSSLVKRHSFASKILSCERKKKVSLVIHTKYILYICATIEIYIYAKQWEPIDRLAGVVRVSPAQLELGNCFFEICKYNFVEFAIAVSPFSKLYLKLYLFKVHLNRADFTRQHIQFAIISTSPTSILNAHVHAYFFFFLTESRTIGR